MGGHGHLVAAGKEDLGALGEGLAILLEEVVGHLDDLRGLASRTQEVDRAVRETQGYRRWQTGGWG